VKFISPAAIFTLTKSNRDATALQVEELLLNIVGSANNPAPIPSIGIVSSPKLGASSISGDIESSYEVTHSVDNGEIFCRFMFGFSKYIMILLLDVSFWSLYMLQKPL
jgi:hypothetical protein